MNDSIVMMLAVSGGFALLAVLAAVWWFATGQQRTRHEGASIPLSDDDPPTAPAMPASR